MSVPVQQTEIRLKIDLRDFLLSVVERDRYTEPRWLETKGLDLL